MSAGGYYKLPLQFSYLADKKELGKCSLENSIAQNIHLIITTKFGEFKLDETYGCSIWEHDFENIFRANQWKEQMAKSVKESIQNHESRLTNLYVKAEVGQEEMTNKMSNNANRIKKKIELKITGNLNLTNEAFEFYEKLFISPFSFD